MFRKFTKKFLILLNIVTSLLFLIGSFGGYAHSSILWFTGYFILAMPYLAVALIGFIFLWLIAKRGWMLISLITLCFAYKPLKNVFVPRLSPAFAMNKNDAGIRVMTWNVEHFQILKHKSNPELKEKMLHLINAYQPDIACFQEMVGSDFEPQAINYLPELIRVMAMKDYHYSFNKKLDFDKDHHFGIIIFSKLPMVSKHTISYDPYDYNSIFQYVDVKKNDDTFRVFNVHLQSLRFTQDNITAINEPEKDKLISNSKSIIKKLKVAFDKKYYQSNRIKEEMNRSPYPNIVCGDFNDVPNSYAYINIGRGMKNAWVEKGSGIGRTFQSISPTLRIDNIFVSPAFEVQQAEKNSTVLSDHYPLITDLLYQKN